MSEANEEGIRTLIEMGLSQPRAVTALEVALTPQTTRQKGGNNVERAIEWHFAHMDDVAVPVAGRTSPVEGNGGGHGSAPPGGASAGVDAREASAAGALAGMGGAGTGAGSVAGAGTTVAGPANRPSIEEEQLNKAIAESLKESQGGGAGAAASDAAGGSKVTTEDEALSRAIEASLADKPGYDPIAMEAVNPHDRVRDDPSLPVGLKNIGNTCYVNSLMQTYFHLPVLRYAVLSFEPAPEDYAILDAMELSDDTATNALRFVQEMQRLFGFLSLTTRKALDVRKVMNTLLAADGKPISMGAQQDAQEFHMRFMQRLEEAFDIDFAARTAGASTEAASPPAEQQQQLLSRANVIRALFQGKVVSVRRGNEADGTPFESVSTESFAEIMVPLADNIYDALDEYTAPSTISGYISPAGHTTDAEELTMFEEFPPVVAIQLRRVVYNAAVGQRIKLNSKVTFPKYLYMDRYHASNAATASKLREQANGLKAQRTSLKAQLESYLSFPAGDAKMPVQQLLRGSLSYLDELTSDTPRPVGAPPAPELDAMKAFFQRALTAEVAAVSKLEESISVLEDQIEQVYAHMTDHPYRLHSVLVHSGGAQSGHYWSFVYEPTEDKWYNFNDATVTVVDEDKVWADSFGDTSGTNAYCLFYVDASSDKNLPGKPLAGPSSSMASTASSASGALALPTPASPVAGGPLVGDEISRLIASPKAVSHAYFTSVVPPKLQDLVEADNAELVAEMAKWDAEHADGAADSPAYGPPTLAEAQAAAVARAQATTDASLAATAAVTAPGSAASSPELDEGKTTAFVAAFASELENLAMGMSQHSTIQDERLESFPLFLALEGMPDIAKHAIAAKVVHAITGTALNADADTLSALSCALHAAGHDDADLASFQPAVVTQLRTAYASFCNTSATLLAGLTALSKRDAVNALRLFAHGLARDAHGAHGSRRRELIFFLRGTLVLVADAARLALGKHTESETSRGLVLLHAAAAVTVASLAADDRLRLALAAQWLSLLDKAAASSSPLPSPHHLELIAAISDLLSGARGSGAAVLTLVPLPDAAASAASATLSRTSFSTAFTVAAATYGPRFSSLLKPIYGADSDALEYT
ncbi:ubiquitin carboxyl-terminal hydrolase [Thecamonas trahens ATCC 50062]|uniref:Ubiquitin carboxyl-terminal hydrolase n=1 Tax=Thecamonas trahens ATCC 50062 TaxID=461836 RepID=A0A0L0DNT4_THETB|nr:ubiquitin carboxyl-terminal hydrolase [Thecamonas trahens ATCC 50062]KNC53974.1 ubiquitin carboxyl-terminal hydrolase [Thecamonas trahens ATCC 50062]|eukprot:XP_013754176.1 ubiquitin carboxyl-terminal hydrolase [Thecamonas trahens ATCC 50062]